MVNFKLLNTATALIALILCSVLILVPEVLFMLFGIDEHSSAFFIGRRAAMLFLGLAVLTWCIRKAEFSESRQAVCLSLSVSMLGLAILGTVEYLRGFAGIGIALAIITEAVLAALYFKVWLSGKNA